MKAIRLWLLLVLPSLAGLALLACPPPAEAQLMIVNRRYTVIAVEADKGIIKVSPADKEGSASDVLVSPQTKMYVFDHEIPSFSWKLLRKGMKITVHGGVQWDMRVKAKKIYL